MPNPVEKALGQIARKLAKRSARDSIEHGRTAHMQAAQKDMFADAVVGEVREERDDSHQRKGGHVDRLLAENPATRGLGRR